MWGKADIGKVERIMSEVFLVQGVGYIWWNPEGRGSDFLLELKGTKERVPSAFRRLKNRSAPV